MTGELAFDFNHERLCFGNPVAVLAARTAGEVAGVIARVEQAAAEGLWAAGFVAYEAAPAFDAALVVRQQSGDGLPLAWFGLYDAPCPGKEPGASAAVLAWQSDTTYAEWEEGVSAIRAAIARGETYQVNYTRRLRAPFSGDVRAWYEGLREAARPASFCAFLDTGRFQIASTSPELFFDLRGRTLTTRPMKGTAPRGRWAEEDEARGRALAASEKERAENVMIVDLLRSDLGRVAATGSVCVPRLLTVERYPSVWQMTSTVEATLRPDAGLGDVLAALFPCGSVTGAPKVETMKHIVARETAPRGVYCGAIGLVRPGGDATFSVAIRTVVLDRETGRAEYGVGGGITWDSTAREEWAETEAKAALLCAPAAPSFDLLETLRLENGVYTLEEEHLARLEASAAYFGWPEKSPRKGAKDALLACARSHPHGAWRVRLLVPREGEPQTQAFTLGAFAPLRALSVSHALSPVSRHDPFLCHKTTHRAVYDAHRKDAPPGVYDVLLWNEQNEATEFTTGNLVAELNGTLYTPPRDCGLLGGVLRADLLARGAVRERVLPVCELESATGLWLVNSVRGQLPVYLMPPSAG